MRAIVVYAGQLVVDSFMKEARSFNFNCKRICAKMTAIRALFLEEIGNDQTA
jgi:hypothetical protein